MAMRLLTSLLSRHYYSFAVSSTLFWGVLLFYAYIAQPGVSLSSSTISPLAHQRKLLDDSAPVPTGWFAPATRQYEVYEPCEGPSSATCTCITTGA